MAAFKEKYGAANPSQVKEIQEKRKQTFLEKYGVDNPFANEEIKQKIKDTFQEKYGKGITNPSQVPELIEKASKKNSETKLKQSVPPEKLGILLNKEKLEEYIGTLESCEKNYTYLSKAFNISDNTIKHIILKYNLTNKLVQRFPISTAEKKIKDFIISCGINKKDIICNSKEFLSGKEIDIYLKNEQIGFEFNGNFWHSECVINKNYHVEKSSLAKENNVKLFYISEYEFDENLTFVHNWVRSIVNPNKQIINSNDCKIIYSLTSEISQLIKNYSFREHNFDKVISLEYNGKIVQTMTFSINDDLCYIIDNIVDSNFCIKDGTERILNEISNVKGIMIFNKIGKSDDNEYLRLGFKQIDKLPPSYIWHRSHRNVIFPFDTNASEEEMYENKYFKIYDAGTNILARY